MFLGLYVRVSIRALCSGFMLRFRALCLGLYVRALCSGLGLGLAQVPKLVCKGGDGAR